jgi:hypothetical protein
MRRFRACVRFMISLWWTRYTFQPQASGRTGT